MRRCAMCGDPIRRWQRGHFHGIYTAVTPYAWEQRMYDRWERSRLRARWRRLVYGDEAVAAAKQRDGGDLQRVTERER